MMNPIKEFHITKDQLRFTGKDLCRPECILATRDGSLWISDARGGVVRIFPNREQKLIVENKNSNASSDKALNRDDMPNGMAFSKDNKIYVANIGRNCLEVIDLDGNRKVLLDSIEGVPIGKVNFVLRDSKDRLWITVSTRHKNWVDAMRPDVKDGYIALMDGNNVRIVADGLSFTNEIRLDKSEKHLYISETSGRKITRMKVEANGDLIDREIYGPSDLGSGGFPDGIAFDSYGNLWGTVIFGEKIFVITPEGDLKIIFNDGDKEACRIIDEAFFNYKLTEEIMTAKLSSVAPIMTSITFGGEDLKTVYIGSVMGSRLPYFKAPVSGQPPVWW